MSFSDKTYNNSCFHEHSMFASLNIIKRLNFSISAFVLDIHNLDFLAFNQKLLTVENIKIQELTFLPEYFLITALFCLTLFAVFSVKSSSKKHHSSTKYLYENQFIFLMIFILVCYLILIYQQSNLVSLTLTSFNETIYNDSLSLVSKQILGVSSILYLLFLNKYLKDQKLNTFEYSIVLFTSIFGFFLLCGANDFITIYLAIELQGLAFYVLASFKKSSNFSVESGVKYFVLGSLSTALFLLGISLLYGLSGSLILTDFSDLFVWAFSVKSFSLSFDTLLNYLEFSQENSELSEDSVYIKLKLMSEKLNFLEEKSKFSEFKIKVPVFELLDFDSCEFSDIELYKNLSEKFLNQYNEINTNSFLGFYDNKEQVDSIFLQTSIFLFSINDFFFEDCYKNSLIDFVSISQKDSLNYQDFESLKISLIKSNFYEDVTSEKVSIADAIFGNSCSVSLSLNQDFFSNSALSFLQFADFLQTLDSKVFLKDELLVSFPDEFVFPDLSSKANLSDVFQNASILQIYMTSLVQVTNLNTFFLEFRETSSSLLSLTFDSSFAVPGFLIIILALFFKLALAPFHLWSPDVYEGSPSSSTFFFMVLSKLGIFVLLLRLCYLSFYSLIHYWQFYSIIVASTSILVGAAGGLKQRKLKSLLTYSSINNMGFVLLAFSTGSFEGVNMTFFYLIVYMLGSICIWSIILNLRLKRKNYLSKQNRDLGDLALLNESNSVAAQGLGITLFSLAGLPPMIGFLAKMGVFKVLSGISVYYLSVLNILFSVIATFYYLRVVKVVFFENILVGNLYETLNSKKVFIVNLLTFLLIFLFCNPMFLYFYSYKITLLFNKSFF